MRFDFDTAKSAANQAKHGIDFVAAQAIWLDPDRLERTARTANEPRFQTIGMIEQTIWSAIWTWRNEDTIRLISCRRARRSEKAQYFDEG